MNLICKITDTELGEEVVEFNNPKIRYGARGIVIRNDGKIAIFNKSNKNEYKLPGGGIENNEEPETAFKREVLEETGCIVEIIKNLGTTEEYKSKENYQSFATVFVAKVIQDTKHLHITDKEKKEGAILLWETPEKALELITNCYDNIIPSSFESTYFTKFVVLRDRKILEYYLNNF